MDSCIWIMGQTRTYPALASLHCAHSVNHALFMDHELGTNNEMVNFNILKVFNVLCS